VASVDALYAPLESVSAGLAAKAVDALRARKQATVTGAMNFPIVIKSPLVSIDCLPRIEPDQLLDQRTNWAKVAKFKIYF
jgi:hypothetical protein